MLKYVFIGLIELYQKTFSPDHGPLKELHPYGFCRQHPTCSQYAKEQIAAKGVVRGLFPAIKRVMGCHPWKEPDPRRVEEALLR